MKWKHIIAAVIGSFIFGYGADEILIYWKLYFYYNTFYEGTPFICLSVGFMIIALSMIAICRENQKAKEQDKISY